MAVKESTKKRSLVRRISVMLFWIWVFGPLPIAYQLTRSKFPGECPRADAVFRGQPVQELTEITRDGVRLSGWFSKGDPHRPAVILVHGIGATRMMMAEQAAMLMKEKYSVILYDSRNHGLSGQAPTTLGQDEQEDIRAFVEVFKRELPEAPIVLWGVSMGAVTALMAAESIPGIVGVIAESPFDTLWNTLVHHNDLYALGWVTLPLVPLIYLYQGALGGFWPFDVAPIESVKKSPAVHMLFVSSQEDTRMTPALVRSIADQHQGETRFFLGKGTHGGIYPNSEDAYAVEVQKFLVELCTSAREIAPKL